MCHNRDMVYETSFRKKVFEIKNKEGLTYEEAAKRFGISIRTIFRWKHKPVLVKKRNKPATKINMEALKKDVQSRPDEYHYERATRFNVSTSAICYAIKRLGIRYKKNAKTSQSRLR